MILLWKECIQPKRKDGPILSYRQKLPIRLVESVRRKTSIRPPLATKPGCDPHRERNVFMHLFSSNAGFLYLEIENSDSKIHSLTNIYAIPKALKRADSRHLGIKNRYLQWKLSIAHPLSHHNLFQMYPSLLGFDFPSEDGEKAFGDGTGLLPSFLNPIWASNARFGNTTWRVPVDFQCRFLYVYSRAYSLNMRQCQLLKCHQMKETLYL
jgi:hypothetical protein